MLKATETQIKKIIEIAKQLGEFLDSKEYPQGTIEIKVDIVRFNKSDGYVTIFTGTRAIPYGISLSTSSEVIFVDENDEYFIKSVEDVKRIIRENRSSLQQDFTKNDFKHIGYKVPLNLFI